MSFEEQPAGTAALVFDDGSALVRGVGGEDEATELHALLVERGCDANAAELIGRVLRDHGLTLAGPGSDYRVLEGATISAGTFDSWARQATRDGDG